MNKRKYKVKANVKKGLKKRLKGGIKITNPNAAGIDLGSETHFACVGKDRDKDNIRVFKCYTADIHKMAKWFKKCGVTTVAMESTGVEWVPVYDILEKEGLDVKLVNARHLKNVPGKKTDIADCQWIQELHTYGLLSGSFRPQSEIIELRGYVRHRQSLVKSSSVHIQRMQKALTQMNIQIHKAISDIVGASGIKILKAIIEGKRNPQELAKLADPRIKNSPEIIAKSLEGNYRKEHLFTLKQEYELYEAIQNKIKECDNEIEKYYQTFEDKNNGKPEFKNSKKGKVKGEPSFNLPKELYRITGVDFTQIAGIRGLSTQQIISEIGLDPSKWPTEKHFASWLGLCPNNKITGGKIHGRKSKKVVNRAAIAFRQAATTLINSKSALGVYHRRMRARLGPMKAVTATAHKLACIFYRMLKFGQEYVDIGEQAQEEQYKVRMLKNLEKKAKTLGLQLVAMPA